MLYCSIKQDKKSARSHATLYTHTLLIVCKGHEVVGLDVPFHLLLELGFRVCGGRGVKCIDSPILVHVVDNLVQILEPRVCVLVPRNQRRIRVLATETEGDMRSSA